MLAAFPLLRTPWACISWPCGFSVHFPVYKRSSQYVFALAPWLWCCLPCAASVRTAALQSPPAPFHSFSVLVTQGSSWERQLRPGTLSANTPGCAEPPVHKLPGTCPFPWVPPRAAPNPFRPHAIRLSAHQAAWILLFVARFSSSRKQGL